MSIIWIFNIVTILVLCVFFAGIVIPQILLIAFRKNLFDMPDERKIHQCAVPRLGGIAFTPVIFFSFILLVAINVTMGHYEFFRQIISEALPLAYSSCAVIMMYLIGIADDLIGVRYRAKFFVQIVCGLMLVAGGVELTDLHGMLFAHTLPAFISIPLTLFVTVFIVNAINLIDGLDGLASGLCSIAFLSYGLTFIWCGHYLYAMLSFATLGVLIPFYYYNVFGKAEKGRKIFMGDTGSLTIGIMLCFLSIQVSNLPVGPSPLHVNPFVMAFAPLLVPCFDVVRVYLHRVRNHKSPFLPDKNHIHHKLLAIGLRQRTAMVTILLISLVLTLLNIILSTCLDVTVLLCIDVAAWTWANYTITGRIHRLSKARQAETAVISDEQKN